MPLPTLPLPTTIAPGDPGHAAFHNNVNQAVNYLVSDTQTQNEVLAAPSGANGSGVFRLLTAADIPNLTAAKISDFDTEVMQVNQINSESLPTFFLKNVVYDNALFASQAPGASNTNIDLYTVPTGKRAVINFQIYNQALSTLTFFPEFKVGGIYYRGANNTTATAITGTNGFFLKVLEAGEIASLNISQAQLTLTQVSVSGGTVTVTGTITGGAANAYNGKSIIIQGFVNSGNNGTFICNGSSATTLTFVTTTQVNETHAGQAIEQTGCNIQVAVMLFDISSPYKSAELTSFINGNNTIYTVPGGKHALITGYFFLQTASVAFSTGYSNQSGLTSAVQLNIVPNGGSVSAGNVIANLSINNDTVLTAANSLSGLYLKPGDFVSINTNQTGKQFAWVNVFEF